MRKPNRGDNSKQVYKSLYRDSCKLAGPLAQLVEQQTLNLWVVGSIPTWLRIEQEKTWLTRIIQSYKLLFIMTFVFPQGRQRL